MPPVKSVNAVDGRRLLVDRVASSPYINKSARLRDLLLYVCERVIEGGAERIHEQEVGRDVFGRPADYDTASDNIVRVHASTLRKRLERYFEAEGCDEAFVIEIPKGNYAPVFRPRVLVEEAAAVSPRFDLKTAWLAALALIFAASTVFLLLRNRTRLIALHRINQPFANSGPRYSARIKEPILSSTTPLLDFIRSFRAAPSRSPSTSIADI